MAGNRNSGRRATPTVLKVVANTRKDRLNTEEPKPPKGTPRKPEGLSARASNAWDRESKKCLDMGTLTVADEEAFATYCELLATRELIALQKSEPEFKVLVTEAVVDMDGGTHLKIRENPLLRMERQTASSLKPYFQMFGLEGSSRARLRTPGDKPNRLKAFLGGAVRA